MLRREGPANHLALRAREGLEELLRGFRGAVLLLPGEYQIGSSITINASGVVLRGEGNGPGGTLIKAVGTARRTLITVSGVGNRAEDAASKRLITDPYVPVDVMPVVPGGPGGPGG